METTVLGYLPIGARAELERATEAFLAGRLSRAGLTETAAALRRQAWEALRDAGLSGIPSSTLSLYERVLDAAVTVNAVPARFAGLDGLDRYFAMARGAEGIAPLELASRTDAFGRYLVPELGPDSDLRLADVKPVLEYLQARSSGIETRPVLLGPLSFLLLSKPAEPGFQPLTLLGPLLDAYAQLLEKLHVVGAQWVQLDEPVLAATRTDAELAALRQAYQRLGSSFRRPAMLVSTYFGEIGDALPVLAGSPVEAIGLDFVAGPGNREALAAIAGIGVKTLVAGVVDGRHAGPADRTAALSLCASLLGLAGNLVVSTCGPAVGRASADEVVALGRALAGGEYEAAMRAELVGAALT